MKKKWVFWFAVWLVGLMGIGNASPERPNILFLSIDDLKPELGCYGVEEIHSPNIDRLAKEGVRFDRAYCQMAVCNPSQVSMLTDLRPDSVKVWSEDAKKLFREFKAKLRKEGKKHLMGYALRTDQYRYVEWIDRTSKATIAQELYDHNLDPFEKQNIAAREENACTVKELAKQLRETLPLPLAPEDPRLAKERPNIVVIMGDDWSAPHASILGDPVVKTPTFDRIAREGLLFENAFVSTPSCTPSRFSVATGQHPWLLGEAGNLGGSLGTDVPVYPDLLKTAGYHVGFSRKGAAPSQHKYRKSDPFGAKYKDFATFLEQRKPEQPFCYWYGAGEPHRPYDWEASKDKLPLEKIDVPPYLPDNETTRTDLGDYYLRIQKLDQLAGNILKKLREIKELENTLIVMAGDNGMPFPRAKATLYDGGTKVPLAIRWGKVIQPNQKTQSLVSLHQLAPLFLKASGQMIPSSMQDHTLLPLMEKKLPRENQFIITGMERHVHPNPSRAIRTQDYLLIRNFSPETWPTGQKENLPTWDFSKTPWPTVPGAFSYNTDPSPTKQWMRQNPTDLNELAFGVRPEIELYQLSEDPFQMRNLAKDPKFQKNLRNLHEKLARELKELKDPRSKQLLP